MNELIASEFVKTIIAVLIGGVISFLSVFAIDIRNRKKELIEKKRLIYKRLISNINILRRYEQNFAQHDLHFNYHRRLYELGNNELLSKEQAEYHQSKRDESQLKIVETSHIIDSSAIDYRIYFGESDKFDKLIMKINFWERPKTPNYIEVNSLDNLNDLQEKNNTKITNYILNHFVESVSDLAKYIKKELK